MMKRGFTLIETLVVLAIVAVGLALVLPATCHSIQEARRARCMHHLKEVAVAMHNYHDTFLRFPPGWVSRAGTPGLGPRVGWQTMILPFMEQVALYNQIDFNHSSPPEQDGKPRKLFQIALSVYRCPADTTPETNPLRGGYGTSNYSGNYGHQPTPRLRPLGLGDFWPGPLDAPMQTRGLFARNSSVAIRDITDGTSNTILAGERCFTSGAGIWAGVTDNAHEDDAVTDCSHRSRINAGWFSFSSRHGGGAIVVMTDGSARFLADTIESKPGPEWGVFQKLGCRNDGQQLSIK